MSLERREVEKVALLARLDLTAADLDRLTGELDQIVHFVEQLRELDTVGVPPLVQAIEMSNVLRDDRPVPGLERAQALANAPQQDGECFLVPPVLG